MNKLEIGMYIRTKGGIIDKILKLNKSYVKGVSQKDELYAYDIDNIVKASYNIIDILESGDYINGVQVIDKEIDNINEKYLQCGVGDYLICIYNSNEIKSIVTKEQFSAMEYRLGDK